MKDDKARWRFVYDNFAQLYPSMASDVLSWYPSGQLEITLKMKDGSKYIYDLMMHGTRCVYSPDDDHDEPTEIEWRREFSYQLEKKIREFGMSQKMLAEFSGVSRSMIANYINCKSTPSCYTLRKLAKALRCSVSELTYFEK